MSPQRFTPEFNEEAVRQVVDAALVPSRLEVPEKARIIIFWWERHFEQL